MTQPARPRLTRIEKLRVLSDRGLAKPMGQRLITRIDLVFVNDEWLPATGENIDTAFDQLGSGADKETL